MIVILFTEPGIVLIEHVVSGHHLPPLRRAEDAVRVIAILANAMKLHRILPVLGQVLICSMRVCERERERERTPTPSLTDIRIYTKTYYIEQNIATPENLMMICALFSWSPRGFNMLASSLQSACLADSAFGYFLKKSHKTGFAADPMCREIILRSS